MEIVITIFLGTAILIMCGLSYYYGYSMADKAMERITERNRKLRRRCLSLKERLGRANMQISILKQSNMELNNSLMDKHRLSNSFKKVML